MLFGGIQQLFRRGAAPSDFLSADSGFFYFQVVIVLPNSCVGQIVKAVDKFLCEVQEFEEEEGECVAKVEIMVVDDVDEKLEVKAKELKGMNRSFSSRTGRKNQY